jgi:hypothetical protein
MARVLEGELKGKLNFTFNYVKEDRLEWNPDWMTGFTGGTPKYVIDRIDMFDCQLWGHEEGREGVFHHHSKAWQQLKVPMTAENYKKVFQEIILNDYQDEEREHPFPFPENCIFEIDCTFLKGSHYESGHSHFRISFNVDRLMETLEAKNVRFSKSEYWSSVLENLPEQPYKGDELDEYEWCEYGCKGRERPLVDYSVFKDHLNQQFNELYDSMK